MEKVINKKALTKSPYKYTKGPKFPMDKKFSQPSADITLGNNNINIECNMPIRLLKGVKCEKENVELNTVKVKRIPNIHLNMSATAK